MTYIAANIAKPYNIERMINVLFLISDFFPLRKSAETSKARRKLDFWLR